LTAYEPIIGVFLGVGLKLNVSVTVSEQEQSNGEIVLLRGELAI
jgi:hypothetical protein